MARPGRWQARTFGDRRLLRAVGRDLRHAHDADRHQPRGRARRAEPGVRTVGARSSRTRRSSSRAATTRAGSDGVPLAHAAVVRAAGRRQHRLRRQLPPGAVQRRVDHKITPRQTLMVRVNVDRFYDTNPNDAVGGTSAPSVARRYTRGSCDGAGQPHVGAQPEHPQRGAHRLSERRSGHDVGGAGRCRPPTPAPARCRSRSASRAVGSTAASLSSRTRCRGRAASTRASRRERRPSHLGRLRQRAGHRVARHVHLPQHDDGAVRSAEALRRAELHAADQLRHHQLRAEAVADRDLRAGQHPAGQRPHDGRLACATTCRR